MTPIVDELLDKGKWNLVPTEIVGIQEHELLITVDYTLSARTCNGLSSKQHQQQPPQHFVSEQQKSDSTAVPSYRYKRTSPRNKLHATVRIIIYTTQIWRYPKFCRNGKPCNLKIYFMHSAQNFVIFIAWCVLKEHLHLGSNFPKL